MQSIAFLLREVDPTLPKGNVSFFLWDGIVDGACQAYTAFSPEAPLANCSLIAVEP